MLLHQCDHDCEEYKDKDHPIPGRWFINGEEYNRCPLVYVEDDYSFLAVAYKMFGNGFLPNNGGWTQQSNKFIQSIMFMDDLIMKYRCEHGRK